MNEPIITINGTTLTGAQAMTVRVALSDFVSQMATAGALGSDDVGEDIRRGYKERSGEVIQIMLTPPPSTHVAALEEQVAFTLSDASRLLRKQDVEGACPNPDDCFYFGDRVRCGPCAVKASAAKGIVVDDTHSHLPEVCRLRRELRTAMARIAELEVAPSPQAKMEPVEIPGELEMFEGKLTKVVDASRTGWWRFHAHRDRDGYCDNPARGY